MVSSRVPRLCAVAALAIAAAFAPAAPAADMNKVIRHVFPAGEEGFDPAAAHDLYSGTVEQAIFETLLSYDYLARPSKLVPLTAETLPQVTDNGQTYTIRIKKGIHFTPDPAFKGVKRELVAEDYVYSLKRLMDPAIRSPWAWLLEGKIVGLDEVAEKAKQGGKFDYNAKVPGLEAVDRYTLRIRLKQPDYNLSYVLAHEPTSAVAREVVAAYGDEGGRIMSNPVGTGPYRLAKWIRSSKIVLEANPDYRGFTWDFKAGSDPEDARIVAEMKGKTMPQVGRIEISIMEEDQSRLLAFQNGELDLMNMEGPLAPMVLHGGTLTPDMQKKGVRLSRFVDPEISYHYWNLMDPVVGGLTKEKIALRRAMAMAYSVEEEIRVVRNNQAIEAQYPIPPGVVGHDPNYRSGVKYDPAAANALLDKFGYKKGADGWRTLPDGKPLVIRYASRPDSLGRQHGRDVEEGVRRHRHPDGGPEGQVRGAPEAREAVQAHDAHRVVDRRLPGRRQLHAAPLRQEHLPEQQRLREDPRVRQALRADACGCRRDPSATSSTTRWRRSSRPTRRGGSTSAATATCWCSRGSWGTRSTRSCTRSGSSSTLRRTRK